MTDVAARLDEVERLFFGERERALDALWELVDDAPDADTLRELVARVDHAHPRLGAELAIAAGSLVEDGLPGETLGRALVAPLQRALDDAARLLGHVAHLPDAEPPADDDEETEDEHPGTEMIGTKRVDHATLDAIAARDRVSVQAWGSLALWYRPAAAVWSRDTALLREAQASAGLRAAVANLGPATETSYWLSALLETLYDARFVFLFPETGEAWTLVADGVVDMGQLYVFASDALREPLARIGVTAFADPRMLDEVRALAEPQDEDLSYACTFHCYPAEATDPATGLPRDGVHRWRAPGGTGSHSLPSDFLPGTLEPIDGHRVLVVAGPTTPGTRFTRGIAATRTFGALRADVSAVARLSDGDARHWLAVAKSRGRVAG